MVCIREEAVIGDNLTIYQNATIGFQKGFPTIGNNVFIGAGVIVIGKIKVGNNVSKKTNHT